jgi:hypothetical protein
MFDELAARVQMSGSTGVTHVAVQISLGDISAFLALLSIPGRTRRASAEFFKSRGLYSPAFRKRFISTTTKELVDMTYAGTIFAKAGLA